MLLPDYSSFTFPWQTQTFSDKLSHLLNSEKKKIVYLYETPDYGTFRYRIHNMCQTLAGTEEYIGSYFFSHELINLLNFIDSIDILVLVRIPWSIELERLVIRAKNLKIKLLYDVDDLVIDINKTPLLMNTIGIDLNHGDFWFSYVAKRQLAASYCEAIITTNNFLARQIASVFNKPVFIIPNFLNSEQLDASQKILQIKSSLQKKEFILGYFSGTGTHNHDFNLIAYDIRQIMLKHQQCKLYIVGFLDLPDCLSKFYQVGRILRFPLLNYLDLQLKIAECDINLIPLQINEFTNCKSELKFFESAIVKTISLMSPSYIYKNIIKHEQTGFLVNQGEWGGIIDLLMQNHSLRKTIEDNSYHYSYYNYFGKKIQTIIANTFNKVLDLKSTEILEFGDHTQ